MILSFSDFCSSTGLLEEGGNVFEETSPIKKEHIEPTLKQFFEQFGTVFPAAKLHLEGVRTLGSVGKKDYSGDIDLAISENSFNDIKDWGLDETHVKELFDLFKKRAKTSTDKQLTKRAVIVAIAEKLQESDKEFAVDIKGSSSGSLFCKFPQYDETDKPNGKYVQVDINVGDLDWLTFAYHSATYTGNVKGLHRTQLLIALFSHKGYTFSHNYGVKSKQTQEIVADAPQKAIDLLNQLYGTQFDSQNIEDYSSVMSEIHKKLTKEDLNAVFDTYLKILDSTRADIPTDLQQYWTDNQQRLNLSGKYLPTDSLLKGK